MATKMVLHSTKENKNTYKARIAAQYAGVELDFPEGFQMGVQNKTPEFLKLNPNGKVRFYPQNFLGMLIMGEPLDRVFLSGNRKAVKGLTQHVNGRGHI